MWATIRSTARSQAASPPLAIASSRVTLKEPAIGQRGGEWPVFMASGTTYAVWEKGEMLRPEIPEAAHAIPVMCNPGAKDDGEKRLERPLDSPPASDGLIVAGEEANPG